MKTGTRTVNTALRLLITAATLALALAGCNSGGGGGGSAVFGLNGGSVSGTVSNTTPTQTYKFDVVADTAYTVSTVSTQGNIWLTVKDAAGALIGYSWNSLTTTPYNNVSFIAATSGTVTVTVQDMSINYSGSTPTLDPASYTLQASDGNLAVGSTRTDSTYNSSIYYSFDATASTAYQVRLTPKTGNVNIGSVNAKQTASVGNSLLAGTEMDTVLFLAPGTQRYYVRVDPTSADTKYDVEVVAANANPDLRAVVNSAISDGTNVTIKYTIYNQGLSATTASFGVDGWSNSASAPTVGTTGQATATQPALAAGASVSGTLVVPDAGASGTAYVIVDTANAVLEFDETNNVSAGKAWFKPLPAPQNITFESATVPAGMTMSGNAGWAIDSTTGGASSTHSLKAGTISSGQSSCVLMSVSNGASISFDYSVGSAQYYDYLNFYIDGVQNYNIYSASGTVPWTNSGAIAVTSGTHEYKWCYVKSTFSSSVAPDTAWIDNIVVTQAQPDLQVAVTSAVSNGSTVTINYTAYNYGLAASGPFNVDFWANSASAPVVGAASQGTLALPSLTAGSSTTGSITIANATANGTAYAIVDNSMVVSESNENNNVSGGYTWFTGVDLTVALNSAVSDKTNVTVNYTVTNLGSSTSSPFNVDVWSNSASAPTVGSTGQSTVSAIPALAGGASYTGSVAIANASATGTAYAIVDTTNAVAETNETNNVSAGLAWAQPVAAPWTYNITGPTTLPTNFVMSGNASWAYYYNGLSGGNARYGIKAGTINPGQSSCIAVSATASSSVAFKYSVGSEAGWDFLQFYIDGVQQGAGWSGAIAFWATSSTYTVATGQHEYKWCYVKSSYSSSIAPDTAWINSIVIN